MILHAISSSQLPQVLRSSSVPCKTGQPGRDTSIRACSNFSSCSDFPPAVILCDRFAAVTFHVRELCPRIVPMKFLRSWKARILLFFAVVGPGFITANVDNDANGIYTYSAAGAQFGHLLLWTLIPITIALIVVQEISARMGAVTGKGLSDLIREEFGLRITFFMMLGILIINFGNVVGEFAGIAGSLELFGLSKYITVPICAVIVWADRGQGPVQERRKSVSCRLFFLCDLHFRRLLRQAGLD